MAFQSGSNAFIETTNLNCISLFMIENNQNVPDLIFKIRNHFQPVRSGFGAFDEKWGFFGATRNNKKHTSNLFYVSEFF